MNFAAVDVTVGEDVDVMTVTDKDALIEITVLVDVSGAVAIVLSEVYA